MKSRTPTTVHRGGAPSRSREEAFPAPFSRKFLSE